MSSVIRLALIACCLTPSFALAEPDNVKTIRVVIWDEQQPAQKKAYPEFIGDYIAAYLKKQPGLSVRSMSINDPHKGISKDWLDDCDVLIWWGHVRNSEVSPKDVEPIIDRLKSGKLNLFALHSAHWATPFVMAMHERAKSDALSGLEKTHRRTAKIEFLDRIVRRPPARKAVLSPSIVSKEKQADGSWLLRLTRPNCCFPAYRNDGRPSKITTLLPDHPIARGIPKQFSLPHTEMYDEPFHVPAPDAVVFREDWELGEHFRSGMIWKVGNGRVFYFRPGHETHSVFTEPLPMKIVENSVRWLGGSSAKK